MFLIYGKRTARIRKYHYGSMVCTGCNSFGVRVNVYRDYYHFFFLPLVPVGINTAKIYCDSCSAQLRSGPVEAEYEERAKAPVHLYSGLILVLGFILFAIVSNLNNQKEYLKYIENPIEGDVYRVKATKDGSTFYYFLRIGEVTGDTIYAHPSHLMYSRFTDRLNDEDFFSEAEYYPFTQTDLKEMLDSGEIQSVERNYKKETGFDRIK